jgi:hypothetical protein
MTSHGMTHNPISGGYYFLRCGASYSVGTLPTCEGNALLPSSGSKSKRSRWVGGCTVHCNLCLIFHTENAGSRFLQSAGKLVPDYKARFHKIVNLLPTTGDMFFEGDELELALEYCNRLESLIEQG